MACGLVEDAVNQYTVTIAINMVCGLVEDAVNQYTVTITINMVCGLVEDGEHLKRAYGVHGETRSVV